VIPNRGCADTDTAQLRTLDYPLAAVT